MSQASLLDQKSAKRRERHRGFLRQHFGFFAAERRLILAVGLMVFDN